MASFSRKLGRHQVKARDSEAEMRCDLLEAWFRRYVPLKQDYVAAVRSIAAGTKRYGKVQWMVRGHKRWQACGIRHQDRKLIWVVPYWKGEVDAPILHRDHVIE